MTALPFVDTHFHAHDLQHETLRYGWLEPDSVHPILESTAPINAQRYHVADFVRETRFSNVVKAIHVNCAVNTPDPVDETLWLQQAADRLGFPNGIIAECHLAKEDVADVLDRHLEFGNLRGVRNFGEGRYFLDPDWRRGFAELGPRNLVSCIDMRKEDADDVIDLARAFHETLICVDHCAVPMERTQEYFTQWRSAIRRLAAEPNLVIKVSGLGMRDPDWTVGSIRPYVLSCIEAFGPGRVVFGTNWPVDRCYSSYGDVLNAYAEIISGFSHEEQVAMFSGNAERIFRI